MITNLTFLAYLSLLLCFYSADPPPLSLSCVTLVATKLVTIGYQSKVRLRIRGAGPKIPSRFPDLGVKLGEKFSSDLLLI